MAYNSVYVVEDGGDRVLVDTGPDYRGARETLEAQLPHLPDRVAITHGHIDHAGLGAYWRERGVAVAIGARDSHFIATPALASSGEWTVMSTFVEQCGAPAEVAAVALHDLDERRRWAQRAASEGAYEPAGRGGRWPTALRYTPFSATQLFAGDCSVGAELDVLPCPGHTPGNIVLMHREEGWLFSGDQLLPTITPTPAIQVSFETDTACRFHSLPHFEASLRRLRDMHFTRCFPGHGDPFDNVDEVIAVNLDRIHERGQRVDAALREKSGASVYELAEALYPRALARRFWQIIATVQGQLDLLQRDGCAIEHQGQWSAI